jgi:PucR family transcriptional regulator, purine catabolism regulatory protein
MSSPARRLRAAPPVSDETERSELGALEAVSAAVEAGAGLPEVVRAAGRALGASLVLEDPLGAVLAVSAQSPADEQALIARGSKVEEIELRVGDEVVGRMLMRARDGDPSREVLSLVKALVASEVERVRAPGRAAEEETAGFLHRVLAREFESREQLLGRASELGQDLEEGGSIVVAHAHPLVPTEEDWPSRVLAVAERGARAAASAALVALADSPATRPGDVVVLVPGRDEALARRVAEVLHRELEAGLQGFGFAIGRSRVAEDPLDLYRAGNEALLAANVAAVDASPKVLAYEETGAYRLLLPTMSEHPEELERFYADTLEPICSYDEQYETDLVQTLETFLDCDGNVAQSAQKLFTHRHTIRYRLERVRELTGLDVSSSDGREKLSLGLKAMRVLGIAAPRGPATEAGAEGGRVPRGPAPDR